VFKQNKFEDAAALLDGLIERYPDKADFWLLQAHTYLGMKQPLRAAENLEALARLTKATVDSELTLGDIYLSESLVDLAATAYMRAIDVDHNQPLARPLRAAEALATRGAFTQAGQLCQHLHASAGGRIDEPDRTRLLKLEARIAMAQGDDAAGGHAITVLEEVVERNPMDGEALMLLGQHWFGRGEPDRAILYYERAASLEAHEAAASIRHAHVLVGMGRYLDAVPLLRRAQEIKPRDDVARYLDQVERLSKSRR
jgi:tetratricopeptide (TPR) repeat protein